MTQKEKAEAYDKAFEIAKNIHRFSSNIAEIKRMEEIFPELKVSEDERIRKRLIEFFGDEGQWSEGISYQEVRAWLEKQGENKNDCPQNHQDVNHPQGCIVFEDFNGGEGFYKVHLDYLNKRQVEEIEEMIKIWNEEQKPFDYENANIQQKDFAPKPQRMVAAKAKEALYDKPVVSKETIRLIIELFISWNGETEAIDIANLSTAVEYINEYINEN